jgi:hypothetical protein
VGGGGGDSMHICLRRESNSSGDMNSCANKLRKFCRREGGDGNDEGGDGIGDTPAVAEAAATLTAAAAVVAVLATTAGGWLWPS